MEDRGTVKPVKRDATTIQVSKLFQGNSGARLSVQESVSLSYPRQEAFAVSSRFSKFIHSPEQPFKRVLATVNEEWERLNFVWLDGKPLGMLVIYNDEGKFLQVVPSPEEIAEAAKKILQVGFSKNGEVGPEPWIDVNPSGDGVTSESCRLVPTSPSSVYVRSLSGPIRYSFTAFPR